MKELDDAELRLEFRHMYKDLGAHECYLIILQMLNAAEIFYKVIREERVMEDDSL